MANFVVSYYKGINGGSNVFVWQGICKYDNKDENILIMIFTNFLNILIS
jgi:hypothetical protein